MTPYTRMSDAADGKQKKHMCLHFVNARLHKSSPGVAVVRGKLPGAKPWRNHGSLEGSVD